MSARFVVLNFLLSWVCTGWRIHYCRLSFDLRNM